MQSLELHHHHPPPPNPGAAGVEHQVVPTKVVAAAPLSIGVDVDDDAPEGRLRRAVAESPVVVVGPRSCCMCHVMRRLLAAVGAHPTVIELENAEVGESLAGYSPALFIGGALVGGIESLMALHVGGQLVPKLQEVGALSCSRQSDAMGI